MRVDDAHNLTEYLARFEITLAVMQDAASLERIAYELVLDAALDGVRYIEVRFCPALNTRGGLSLDDVVTAVMRGLARGEVESGSVARIIICALRSLPWPHALEMAELAVAFKGRGVVAFDLAGGELGNPAHAHALAFDFAHAHDMAVTVHAGEGDGAHSIREAVHRCATHRIGHGTRLHEDASLESFVVDRQIPLEVCPDGCRGDHQHGQPADERRVTHRRVCAMRTASGARTGRSDGDFAGGVRCGFPAASRSASLATCRRS
jgi:adenosine deaminase